MKRSQFAGRAWVRGSASIAIAAAAAAAMPAQASHPTVNFRAPQSGQTVSGTISGSGCQVDATSSAGMKRVTMYIGSMQIASDYSSPWNCTFDTRKVRDGDWTMRVEALNNRGELTKKSITVRVRNGGTTSTTSPTTTAPAPAPSPTPVPVTSAIATGDIIGQAREDIPFSQQSGYIGQVLGKYPAANTIPETGIHGTKLSNGETLRLGKLADPTNSSRKALAFQLHPNDTSTSGSKRSEIQFPKTMELNKVYWVAMKVFIPDWGTLASNDTSIFGTQLHSGDSSLGLSPSFSLVANGNGRSFQVYTVASTASRASQSTSVTTRHASKAIPFGRWVDFVFKVKQNTSGNGLLQAWMDGTQIVNYTGSIGFNTPGYKDYMKFGYYNWSSGFNSSRKVLLRKPTLVLDPTGSKYSAAILRAHINK